MESIEELKARLERVIEQKDRYGEALAHVLDAIRDGRYNGLFEAGYRGKKDGKSECPQGVSYRELKWCGCPKVLSCPTIQCPMTFEMRKITEAYQKGLDVCREQDAAKIPFDVNEIPPYEPAKYSYLVSRRWFAKRMVRLIQAMRLGTENKDIGGNASIMEAYRRLVAFGMESIGMRRAWLEFVELEGYWKELAKQGNPAREVEKLFGAQLEASRHFQMAAKASNKLFQKRDKIKTMIQKAPSRALRYLVLFSLITLFEFEFTHDYPDCDLGIYSDTFAFIVRCCLYSERIKLDDRFSILAFGNSDDEEDDFLIEPLEGGF